VQSDIKRVLAYSTVSQLGYMMAAIGAGFAAVGFLHLLTHGIFKALLFLAAGAVIHAVGTNEIFAMGGLARRMPQTFAVFLVGTLSLAGIPLFAGFFSKEAILGAVWAGGLSLPFAMLVVAACLTAFYMFRVVFIAFLGAPAAAAPGAVTVPVAGATAPAAALAARPGLAVGAGSGAGPGAVAGRDHSGADAHAAGHARPGGHSPPGGPAEAALLGEPAHSGQAGPHPAGHAHSGGHPHDAPLVMNGPLWILALGSLAIGIGFAVAHPALEFELLGWITPLAIAVAVAGIALAWLVYHRRAIDAGALARAFGPLYHGARAGFWVDDLFIGLYQLLVLWFARLVGWIDRYLVDGIVNALSAWTLSAGDRLRRMQSGRAQDYVYGVAVGILLLLVWSQWPR
jgi:NADH-quinone oxidoreductase subunit L